MKHTITSIIVIATALLGSSHGLEGRCMEPGVQEEEKTLYEKATPHSMRFQGIEREYYMYVPDSLSPNRPLVFMLHGYGGNAYGYRPEMLETARKHGFALCIPQGVKEDGKYKAGWNVRYPKQAEMKTDDVAFIVKLARKLVKEYGLDSRNCFFSGMSNGGEMAYIMAYQHPGMWAAIASVAGLEMKWLSDGPAPKGHVPFMEVHGTADPTSHWEGDPFNEGGWGEYLAVPIAVGNLVSADKCVYEKVTELPLKNPQKPSRQVILHQYLGSPYGCEVRLYEVTGAKHAWHMDDLDTTEEIWSFFEQYLR